MFGGWSQKGFGSGRLADVNDGRARSPEQIWADWMAANTAEDLERAGACADEMTRAVPESFHAWYEAALHAKAVRDWTLCAARNKRALSLFTPVAAADFGGANPAAWNLGIAATALGDWTTARQAWSVYGFAELDQDSGPIDVNYGRAPIRLNPDRPSLALQQLPHFGDTEVVWCWRRSPAHAVIASVPLPESGHRFGDVILHDGQPKGTRRLGDREVSVLDELAKLQDSRAPTWQAVVTGATPGDFDVLGDLGGSRGLGVDDWSGIDVMCADCSHGSPDAGHRHQPAATNQMIIGLAGHEPGLRACLDEWLRTTPRIQLELRIVWP